MNENAESWERQFSSTRTRARVNRKSNIELFLKGKDKAGSKVQLSYNTQKQHPEEEMGCGVCYYGPEQKLGYNAADVGHEAGACYIINTFIRTNADKCTVQGLKKSMQPQAISYLIV